MWLLWRLLWGTGIFPLVAVLGSSPLADPGAIVQLGRARFTVLTSILLRLEFAKDAREPSFDDRATLIVINRRLPVTRFHVERPDDTSVVIATDHIRLTYNESLHTTAASPGGQDPRFGFQAGGLRIDLLRSGVFWEPGLVDPLNLNGTMGFAPAGFAGGLDCYSTPEECDRQQRQLLRPGLLSRSGWSVVNDTVSTRFLAGQAPSGEIPWLDSASARAPGRRLVEDLYFLGAGQDYVQGLRDWAAISGKPALPPLAAFGVWFSHYTVFSGQDYLQKVIGSYDRFGLPLSMAVLDVPWHYDRYVPPLSDVCNNWGGYTPNATLFPDFRGFVSAMHARGLKIVLSHHGQTGVSPCELHYRDMAAALGLPEAFVQKRLNIDCALDNQTWVQALFNCVMAVPPLDHVDYWWNDFPGCASNVTGWDRQAPETLFWANYVMDQWHRQRGRRSVLLSRYGGLGSQRFGVGFSGDTFQNFSTLDWEVEMTPASSNVLFGFWSHDVGGFHNGSHDPGDADPSRPGSGELLLRWVQFGVLSPVFRTHGDPESDRYVWDFSTFHEIKALMLLRNALVPYIYTMAREAHDDAISIVRPMYYSYGSHPESYAHKGQYLFGDCILAAPITSPASSGQGGAVERQVWLPPEVSGWMAWDGTQSFNASVSVLTRRWALEDIPLFVKVGSVLPTRSLQGARTGVADPLTWILWLGSAWRGEGQLYEDEGEGLGYEAADAGPPGEPVGWATSGVSFERTSAGLFVRLSGARGQYPGQVDVRRVVLQLRALGAQPAIVRLDGAALPHNPAAGSPGAGAGWRVAEQAGTEGRWVEPVGALVISLGRLSTRRDTEVDIIFHERSGGVFHV